MLPNLKKIPFDKKYLKSIPDNPGVYIFWSENEPLYVGKSVNLKSRISSYKALNLTGKTSKMICLTKTFSFINVDGEIEALLLEARLVSILQTPFNIQLKDDKHPLYIKVTDDKYPLVLTSRKIIGSEKNREVFGPFPSSTSVKKTLSFIRKVFPYSQHLPGKRPCIYSQMGLCDPCPTQIENEPDKNIKAFNILKYDKNINYIRRFLKGDLKKVISLLKIEMDEKIKSESFEEASEIKTQVNSLEYITTPRIPANTFLENPNFSEDLRKKETDRLRNDLLPFIHNINTARIECYDVAHLSGTYPSASMVTFINGSPEKSLYRHFKINQKNSRDDVSSLKEVAQRRIKHLSDWGKPDLIIVDGGKGQVGVFNKVFKETKISVIGIAKRRETLIIPQEDPDINYISFELKQGPSRNLVQRLRNEAHRFARRLHHRLVEKNFL